MDKFLHFCILFFFFTGILSFLIVFVLGAAIKISYHHDFSGEFEKYKIGRYSLPIMVVSFLMIFVLSFSINKIALNNTASELANSKTKIQINGTEIINDSLYNDLKKITNTSYSRNTGSVTINIVLENDKKVTRLILLRDFSDHRKYWVSSDGRGMGCYGEINTKYLDNYK